MVHRVKHQFSGIAQAPASHSREQEIKGGGNMIMTNAMRAELELMQLCLEGSEENKIEIALEILARILK